MMTAGSDLSATGDSASPAGVMTGAPDAPDQLARRRHYSRFYGLTERSSDAGPLIVVHGNCQAGSLRRLLASAGADAPLLPPVHELTASDLPHLRSLLTQADFLVSQPIRTGYRDLPIGLSDLQEHLPPRAHTVQVTPLRFAGYFPAQVTLRPSWASSTDPPLVAYHDLRTLLIARRHPEWCVRVREPHVQARIARAAADLTVRPGAVKTIAQESIAELARRSAGAGALEVSDLQEECMESARTHHTLNHPTNALFELAATRIAGVLRSLGADIASTVSLPDFEMLGSVRAEVEDEAALALHVDSAPWSVDGAPIDAYTLRTAHLAWYGRHPDFVEYGLEHHRERLEILGWNAHD